jgi:dCMP deaminase
MKHCDEGGCPRVVNAVPSGTPYDYGPGLCVAIHAEANALLHSDFTGRAGGTLYVNGPPCFGCAKLIANSGVERCVYLVDESRLDHRDSAWIMREASVDLVAVWPHEIEFST